MKVCTDACIQGAYTAARLFKTMDDGARRQAGPTRILDIGTGTGLLSLMLAQELPRALIEAVELDEAACGQARANFDDTAWSGRLRVLPGDIRSCVLQHTYDFIICNPPFYEHDLKSPLRLKNEAKHSVMLSHQDLLDAVVRHLSGEGWFCVMLPVKQAVSFRRLAGAQDFYPEHVLCIRHSPAHADFRQVLYFRRDKQDTTEERLCIRDEKGAYTASFSTLLRRYYLCL